jgi:hypothetical protein
MSTTPLTPPPVPQRNPSNLVWWILGILGAGVVLVLLGILLIGAYFARGVHIRQAGSGVEIQTPMGALKVDKDAHATGLPVYPGAVSTAEQGGRFEFDSRSHDKVSLSAEHYSSPDSLEQVQEWYRNHLASSFRQEKGDKEWSAGDQGDLRRYLPQGRGEKAAIKISSDDLGFVQESGEGARIVGLKRNGTRTEIDLVSVGKRQPI